MSLTRVANDISSRKTYNHLSAILLNKFISLLSANSSQSMHINSHKNTDAVTGWEGLNVFVHLNTSNQSMGRSMQTYMNLLLP